MRVQVGIEDMRRRCLHHMAHDVIHVLDELVFVVRAVVLREVVELGGRVAARELRRVAVDVALAAQLLDAGLLLLRLDDL
eukprot:5229229-Pleurochrysis_carterae.AAC.1